MRKKAQCTNTSIKAEFTHHFFNCDNFRQKDAAMLIYSIDNSRLTDDMKHYGYGHIAFDESDDQHRYPEITYKDKNGNPLQFSTKNGNCIVFSLPQTKKNEDYDTLFLYHTNSAAPGQRQGMWYGWLAYDSRTKQTSHRFFVDHDLHDLMIELNRFFIRLKKVKHYEELLKESRKNSRDHAE